MKNIINNIFPYSEATENIGIICYSIYDEEAVFEISFFLNKSWIDITPELWEKHWNSVSFFSDYGFYFFLPAIILSSTICYDKTNLAVSCVFSSLCRAHALYAKEFSHKLEDKWLLFNSRQCSFIRKWLLFLKKDLFRYGVSAEEFFMAETVLLDLRDEAKLLEERIRQF